MKVSGIYAILNIVNDKFYIGSSIDINQRWIIHRCNLNTNRHPNKYLQSSYNKYGKQAFIFVIVEIIEDPSVLVQHEQFYIDSTECCKRNIGYNLRPTANSMLGYKASDETKAKLAAAIKRRIFSPLSQEQKDKIAKTLTGYKHTDEAKRNMRLGRNPNIKRSAEAIAKTALGNKGKKRTLEQRKHIADGVIGRKLSEETKRKMSEARKGKKVSEEIKINMINVWKIRKERAKIQLTQPPLMEW